MRRIALLALAGGLLVGAAPSAAPAQVTERIRVATAGGQLTQSFPPAVWLFLGSPPSYSRASFDGTSGRWVGPHYAATVDGSVGGETSISWSLRFAEAKDAVAASQSLLQHGWPVDIKGNVSIPHVIGNRTVGTILGYYVLTHPAGAGASAYEAGLAFAVGPRVFALLHLDLPDPLSDDAGGAGTFLVNGLLPSVWNRGQAFWVLTGLELHGALPPTRVSAVVVADGRTVLGTVADAFQHPVVRASVALQRASGAGWHTVATTKTNSQGRYVLRGIARRGRYRAVATLGAAAVRSSAIVAGPIARAKS